MQLNISKYIISLLEEVFDDNSNQKSFNKSTIFLILSIYNPKDVVILKGL